MMMAAPLPAIHNTRGHSPILEPVMQHRVPSPPNKMRPAEQYTKPKYRMQGRRDRQHSLKNGSGRNRSPQMSKIETQKYRNTFFHNLCLEVLQEGFHRSFSEIFALVKHQQKIVEDAGADSLLQDRSILADQHEKLRQMKQHLTEAELALRQDDMNKVYAERERLAMYFLDENDLWLADHFFQSCLETATRVVEGGDRKEAEAHCNIGLGFERRGEFSLAADHFEAFYTLTSSKEWLTKENLSLHSEACEHLRRLYTATAQTFQSQYNTDHKEAIDYLTKAHQMAKESKDGQKEGEASYRLGQAYERSGDSETALMHLQCYMDICKRYNDQAGMGQACEAIAKSYERQGKRDEAVTYLEMFVEIAEKNNEEKALSQACSCLGAIYNSLGEYEKASHYFGKAYTMARSLGDPETVEEARTQFGISSAHKALTSFVSVVESPSRKIMAQLMNWKDVRNDAFVVATAKEEGSH
ncbi:tetratricopeptide repeat protein 29-like [Lytechinus pictus]|uniref:tetratricopeptide repeat protein 29-like n=1 Tax=Lytechinus pictus TaxID=7653 RepID=UPI00240E3077|nr:tetratricopeptide repeat protein 29-like [Lytechinus pictus]